MDGKTEEKGLHQRHRARMRNRFLASGGTLDSFAEHEVLEMLLYNFIPYKDTNRLAHQLLKHFGTIMNVLRADKESLMTFGLIGDVAATNIKICYQAIRYAKARQHNNYGNLNSSALLRKFTKPLLEDAVTEEAVIVALDSNFKVLNHTRCRSASCTKLVLDMRKLLALISQTNPTYIAFAHVHPDSDSTPSEADNRFTSEVLATLSKFDVMVVEHLVFGQKGDFYSYFASGIIPKLLAEHFGQDNVAKILSYDLSPNKT